MKKLPVIFSQRPFIYYTDERQRLALWATKPAIKLMQMHYLYYRLPDKAQFTEQEINEQLNRWHIFNDAALLRRELVDYGFLARTKDCRTYWKLPI